MRLKERGTNGHGTAVEMSQGIVVLEVGRGTSSSLREGQDLTVTISRSPVNWEMKSMWRTWQGECWV